MSAKKCIEKYNAKCTKQYLAKCRKAFVASQAAKLPPSAAASKRAATTPKRPARAPVTPGTQTPIHLLSGAGAADAFVATHLPLKKTPAGANRERLIASEYTAEYNRIKYAMLDEAREEIINQEEGKSHKSVFTIVGEYNQLLKARLPAFGYSFNQSSTQRWLATDETKESEHGNTKIVHVFLDSVSSFVRANQAAGNSTNSKKILSILGSALDGSPRTSKPASILKKWKRMRPASAATKFVVPVEMRRHLWCTIRNYETWVKALSAFYVDLGFGVEEVTDNNGCLGSVRMYKGMEDRVLNAVSFTYPFSFNFSCLYLFLILP